MIRPEARRYPLPSGQRRNVLFVALDGAVIGLMSAAASFVSVWVIRLGASPLWVSLLSSLPCCARGSVPAGLERTTWLLYT